MTRTPKEFHEKHPDFCGLADDFSDPPPSSTSDEATAKRIRSDWPPADRVDIFKRLLSDSDRILVSIDSDWEPLSVFTNRAFRSAAETKEWLLRMRHVWQDELSRLEKS